jgi:tetratricopeptide (TPR) repeat protein
MMWRISLATMLMMLIGTGLTSKDAPKSRFFTQITSDAELVPDMLWIPDISDKAAAFSDNGGRISAVNDYLWLDDYAKLMIASDMQGLKSMIAQNKMIALDYGTKLLILERIINPYTAKGVHVLEVRVLEGEHKGKKLYVMELFVERLIPRVLVRDTSYKPTEGDDIAILEDLTFVSSTWAALDDFYKAKNAKQDFAVEDALRAGDMFLLNRGTKINVVTDYGIARRPQAKGFKDLVTPRANAAEFAATHPAGVVCEVRILEGKRANQVVFVPKRDIGRLIDKTPGVVAQPPPAKRKPATAKKAEPKAVSSDAQAASSLRLGKNLRFEGKRDGAIEYFRKAITLAPDSPAAKEAKEILKAMGAK